MISIKDEIDEIAEGKADKADQCDHESATYCRRWSQRMNGHSPIHGRKLLSR